MNTDHPAITANGNNPRLARQLARMVGIFGSQGWPEVAVSMHDGTLHHFPLPKESADKVFYARKVIIEYGLTPITD